MITISGNGSVFYRENRNRYVVQYVIDDNGTKKKKNEYYKTKQEAYNRLNEIMYKFHNNMFIRENGIPLIQVLKQNREDKFSANLISESHYARLEFVIKEIENSEIGNIAIDKITARNLQDYFNSLITRYSDSTIKKVWECVKQGFEVAIDEKYIVENPFRKLRKPKSRKDTKIVEALSPDDENKLASYLLQSNLSQEKYKCCLLIQLYAGLRVGEALALQCEDIDFNSNRILVRKTITVDKDGCLTVKNGAKTAAGIREIPINPLLITPLKEQIEISQFNKDHFLFTFEDRIIKASTINTVLKRICKQLDLPSNISNHVLRHTFGTRCIEAGMSTKVVQSLMGHNDIKVTLNTYTMVQNQFKDNEFKKITNYYLSSTQFNFPNSIELSNNDYSVSDMSSKYNSTSLSLTENDLYQLFGSKEKYEKAMKDYEIEYANWYKNAKIREAKKIKESFIKNPPLNLTIEQINKMTPEDLLWISCYLTNYKL